METISRKIITCISLNYFLKELHITQKKLGDMTGFDHSSISIWSKKKACISENNYSKLLSFFDEVLENDKKYTAYLISELVKEGFDQAKCQLIIDEDLKLSVRLSNLVTKYKFTNLQLQYILNIPSIINNIKAKCNQFKNIINFNEQQLVQDVPEYSYSNWIFGTNDNADPNLVNDPNYLILNFPNNYRVALILTNHAFSNILKIGDSITRFKENNHIQLIIVFTDNDIAFSYQKYYMENHNLFFETITQEHLKQTSLSNVNMRDILTTEENVKSFFYAQAVYERLISYFDVIHDEIVFRLYNQNRNKHNEVETFSKNSQNLLNDFAGKILLKDIYKYSYLARHTIYFERARLQDHFKKTGFHGTAVEINFSNSFISSCICDTCKKLYLFTSSYHSLHLMKDFIDINGNNNFPRNIYFHMIHPSPQYLYHQYHEELGGKVDLVIIGFGNASNINSISEYLRCINSLLTDNGVVFISFENTDSVLLRKSVQTLGSHDVISLATSENWKYATYKGMDLKVPPKRYNVDEARNYVSTYVKINKCYTYPFLSCLINASTSEPENWLRNEIREADKNYAYNQNGRHGHIITLIGSKISSPLFTNLENRSLTIQKLIYEFLNKQHVEYKIIKHSATLDTGNLFKTLIENNIKPNDFDLIKTVILHSGKNSNDIGTKYIIAPRECKIRINRNKVLFYPEKEVTQNWGTGSVSPFVVISTVSNFTKLPGKIYLLGFENLSHEHVIMSSGINTESIQMNRQSFVSLMKKLGGILVTTDKII